MNLKLYIIATFENENQIECVDLETKKIYLVTLPLKTDLSKFKEVKDTENE